MAAVLLSKVEKSLDGTLVVGMLLALENHFLRREGVSTCV